MAVSQIITVTKTDLVFSSADDAIDSFKSDNPRTSIESFNQSAQDSGDLVQLEAELTETNWGQIGGGIGGGALLILLLVFLAGRRRKKLSEMGLVESWASFDGAVEAKPVASELDQAGLIEDQDGEMPKMIDL